MRKRLIHYLAVVCFSLCIHHASAQTIIKGRIADAVTDAPLVGATVNLEGSTVSAITDEAGNYVISVSSEISKLKVSYIGYQTAIIDIQDRTLINIGLKTLDATLDEGVVVGYGTQKKINLTGSVSMTDQSSLNKPVGQTSLALQGVASGVTVTPTSGRPGAGTGRIRIRGIGTLGNAAPLVLVDGVEMNLQDVDPNDIENIAVLKDAASAAIYGSRAANGVILVTTRRGLNNKLQINYNMYVGQETPTSLPNLVNGLDHMLLLNEANRNMGQNQTFSDE